ncbi:LOW QUALITY PROTEIN: hypothetical protein ACHAWO_002121 [Cyclotella atomus]|uniref:Uncharacterized protein n=1 Tax=Cyclotella atomus TaxID=382360 RepID=A0ABD3NMU7_9STRA
MNNSGTDGTAIPYRPPPPTTPPSPTNELLSLRKHTATPPTRPLDFPTPYVKRGVRMKVLAFHPKNGERRPVTAIQRTEFFRGGATAATVTPQAKETSTPLVSSPSRFLPPQMVSSPPSSNNKLPDPSTYIAYWPQRRLQDAIYDALCRPHPVSGEAAGRYARAAGMNPATLWHPSFGKLPINTGHQTSRMRRVHAMRGRLLEDPIKEIAALQLIGGDHPNVLGSSEVLQDNECLYSVMPFCRGGDLFGIVLAGSGGEAGE